MSEKRNLEEQKDQFEEKVLFVNRCSKVVKGGRKFSFSALILVGDGEGRIGYGFAKANEISDAIRKGGQAARKNLYNFPRKGTTIPHQVEVNYDGARLILRPAKEGTGIVAGSKVRSILEMAQLKDVVAKSLGSSNAINQIKATFKALLQLKNPEEVFAQRSAE